MCFPKDPNGGINTGFLGEEKNPDILNLSLIFLGEQQGHWNLGHPICLHANLGQNLFSSLCLCFLISKVRELPKFKSAKAPRGQWVPQSFFKKGGKPRVNDLPREEMSKAEFEPRLS